MEKKIFLSARLSLSGPLAIICTAPRPGIPELRRQIILLQDLLAGRVHPVQQKNNLHRPHRLAPHQHMRVAPEAVGFAAAQVLVAHIKPAHEADIAVDDHDFTVIPVVDPAGEKVFDLPYAATFTPRLLKP